MRITKSTLVLTALLATSCSLASKNGQTAPGSNSSMKSVTVKNPDLRKKMDGKATDAEKDALMPNLKYKVSIKGQNCDTGITADSKDFDEKLATDLTVDSTFQVKKGCDYVVTLTYRDSKADKIVLKSDGVTVNLKKADLLTASPVASVILYATEEGSKYWNTGKPISPDTNTQIEPQLGHNTDPAAVPDCMTKAITVVADGVTCLDSFQKVLIAAADPVKSAVWYANYAKAVNTTSIMPQSDGTDQGNAALCKRLDNQHGDYAAGAIGAICGGPEGNCAPQAEQDFRTKYSSLIKDTFEPRLKEVQTLLKCTVQGPA
jgi:hypothetical protein